jgi:hypothetical protein
VLVCPICLFTLPRQPTDSDAVGDASDEDAPVEGAAESGRGADGQPASERNANNAASGDSKQDGDAGGEAGGSATAQLALDTEVQTATWLLASQTRAHGGAESASAPSGTASSSSPSTTAPLRLPVRLTKSWQKEVSDFALSKSSFGGLYEKRMHILRVRQDLHTAARACACAFFNHLC